MKQLSAGELLRSCRDQSDPVAPGREVVAGSPYHPLAGHGSMEPAVLNGLEFIGFDEDLPIQREMSIMPARIMHDELTQGRLVAIPLATGELFRPLGIIHRRKKRFHRVAQGCVELLCEGQDAYLRTRRFRSNNAATPLRASVEKSGNSGYALLDRRVLPVYVSLRRIFD